MVTVTKASAVKPLKVVQVGVFFTRDLPEPQYSPTEQALIAWMKDCGWKETEKGITHAVTDDVYIAWGDAVRSCIEVASGV